jgi:uncharacterized protein (TIGR03435 family)
MTRDDRNIDEILKQRLPSASADKMEVDAARVLNELRSGESLRERIAVPPAAAILPWRRMIVLSAAAAAVILISFLSVPRFQNTATIRQIQIGERVRSESGTLLSLADGSRVEMSLQTELSLEQADDGMRIRLNRGGIIVNAAKQRTGHLYVQTKDVTVSVVGTVFLVHAEEKGSRVTVIQGEVQVQQGTMSQTLLPGQQIATNPIMQSVPVIQELSWSRNAAAHAALLQQSLALLQQPVLPATQNPPEPRVAFEVVSIKPGDSNPDGSGRGGAMPFGFGCGGSFLQIDPGRFAITTNVFTLVALAYGKQCVENAQRDLLIGGPGWVKSDQFTIQATIPDGSPAYNRRQLMDGNAPKLQQMIQTLLMERFKVSVHRDNKEMAVYALTVAKNGPKLMPFEEGSCDPTSAPTPRVAPGQKPACARGYNVNPRVHFNLWANGITLDRFAQLLTGALDRPVIDRTGITGAFEIHLESDVDGTMYERMSLRADDSPPSVFDAFESQLGLKLESVKAPVEVLVIDHAEKPSEN